MYPELYQYLLQHKKLPVPGIGTFLLERNPANVDFPNKKVIAPVYSFSLKDCEVAPSRNFYCWLGGLLNISDKDAVIRFNDFSFELRQQLDEGAIIKWDGVGTIRKGLGGDIRLISSEWSLETPVHAEKVLREKAKHFVRVGEQEKTSEEMELLLNKEEHKRSLWWVWALLATILALVFICWYLSQRGIETSSAANEKELLPLNASPSYRELQ